MQVGKASKFLSLVAFSGLVAGPSWAGQVFDRMAEDEDEAGNPEARQRAPKFFAAEEKVPCESAGC